jgi:hypothetical protein
LASNTKASLRRPIARGSTEDTVPLARYAIIRRYIVDRLTPSSQATASTSTIVSLLSPCRFNKPRIASLRRQPSSLRLRAWLSPGTSSSPNRYLRLVKTLGGQILTLNGFVNPYSQVKWIFSTKMAQRKALILCRLNSHAKMASDILHAYAVGKRLVASEI